MRFHKIIPYVLVILFFANSVFANKLDKDIQKIIDTNLQENHIPGVQVSIFYPNEKTSHDYVAGNITLKGVLPVQTDNMFQIGSETKTFVATLLLMLEAEKKLSLDEKITKYLPQLPSAWQNITVRQLLNHTSGIFEYLESPEWHLIEKKSDYQKQWTMQELVSFALKEPLYFEPGHGHYYSNTNYILVGMIIEAVSGQSVERLLQTKIFTPLGLQNSYYLTSNYTPTILSRMVHGYSETGYFEDEPKDVLYFNNSWGYTAGGMVSTTHDLALFLQNLQNGNLLPVKQMHEMAELVSEDDGHPLPPTDLTSSGDGLGIGRNLILEEEIWGHSGSTFGYDGVMIWWKAKNITLAISTSVKSNNNPGEAVKIALDIITYLKKQKG